MSNLAAFDTLRTVAFGSIGSTYGVLGTALTHETRVVHLVNQTDQILFVSTDGTNDMIAIPTGVNYIYNVTSNQDQNEKFRFAKGTQFFVRHGTAAPTLGSVFLITMYAKTE